MDININRRIAISSLFFLSGICFSSWASRIPDIKLALNLSEGELGGLLLGMPIGSFVALPLVSWLVDKIGSRRVVILAGILYPCVLPFIGLAPSFWVLAAILIVFGMCGNLLNISMNAQAIGVQKLYGKTILASFHGLWSLAGFTGGAIGALMIGQELPPLIHFIIVSVICYIIVAFAFRYTLKQESRKTQKGLFSQKPEPWLLRIGLISLCGMVCEGCMFDWSGVYFQKVVQAEEALITAGYIAFMSTMALGRFISDFLTDRLGAVKMLQISSALIFIGLLIAVIFPSLVPAIIGFFLVGFGVSSVIPLAYTIAGSRSSNISAGVAISIVSSVGYFGFLFGPPIIGFIAESFNLRVSFTCVALMGALIGLLAIKVKAYSPQRVGVVE
ncbi:MFS transporter [Rhodocytophaga rosea]|uniref:MFS transporter n=1 Tax=Rhodocytophaga rosea TaxID=2704465 RepID=A0A6C0GJH2_9BACT|nr:MFS transporter [Rhodocytophaga rosea]QHT68087.1 MFS transporter [Rhodocytophaga rosea]